MASAKDRILDASFELFRRQGLTGTGIKQILEVAEAPYGSLYHHFPGGKDELAAETIRRAGTFYGLVVLEVLQRHDDPVEAVRASFVEAARDLEESGYADACPVETVALEVASTNEPLRVVTAEVFDLWLHGLRAWLVDAGIDDVDLAQGLADTILAALEGAFVLARSMRSTRPLLSCGASMARLVSDALEAART